MDAHDLEAGLRAYSPAWGPMVCWRLQSASAAVTSVPLWYLTPFLIVKVQVRPSLEICHSVAMPGAITFLPSLISEEMRVAWICVRESLPAAEVKVVSTRPLP